jgi:quinol monooxygenase YgiN
VVVAAESQPGRYLVIDGYKRIAAFDDSLASTSVERATRLRNPLW